MFWMKTFRSQKVYQLKDEADFPPLQAGCRWDWQDIDMIQQANRSGRKWEGKLEELQQYVG